MSQRKKSADAGSTSKPSSSLLPLSALLGVLVVGLAVVWWQTRPKYEPPPVIPMHPLGPQAMPTPEVPRKPDGREAVWVKTLATLEAELEKYKSASEAYLKERRERPSAGKFELPAKSVTSARFRQLKAQFQRRDLETYRRQSLDAGQVQEAAVAFFEAYFQEVAEGTVALDRRSVKLGKTAYEAGAHDPLFLVYQAISCFETDAGDPKLLTRLDTALADLAANGRSPMAVLHGHVVGLTFASKTTEHDSKGEGSKALHKRRVEAVDALEAYVRKPINDPIEPRVLCELLKKLYKGLKGSEFQMFVVLTEAPNLDPWHRHLWLGVEAIEDGWKARGSGYADTVSEGQWKQFFDHLDKASKHLLIAWSLHPDFPEAATEMITVGMADSRHLPGRFWFCEAAAAQADYVPAYDRFLHDLLPRWGGSHQKMIDFGAECLQTGRYDLNVPQQLMFVMRSVERDLHDTGDVSEMFRIPGSVAAVRRLSNELLQKRDASDRSYFESLSVTDRSSVAKYLAMAGEYSLAGEVLDACGNEHDDTQFASSQFPGVIERAWIRGMAGSRRDDLVRLKYEYVQMASKLKSKISADAVLKAATSLREPTEPESAVFLDFIASRANMRLAFDRGDWVPLICDGSPNDVWTYHSDWRKQIQPEVVDIGCLPDGDGIQMELKMKFPPPYEIEVSIEQPNREKSMLGYGILIGDFDMHEPVGPLTTVMIGPPDVRYSDKASESLGFDSFRNMTEAAGVHIAIPARSAQRLGLLVWPKTFEVQFGSEAYAAPPQIKAHYVPSSDIAVGWWLPYEGWGSQHLRVSSPRIRKLSYGPSPAPDASFDSQLKYYGEMLRIDPKSARAYQRLAKLLWKRERETASQYIDRALELDPDISGLHVLRAHEYLVQSKYAEAMRELEDEYKASRMDYFTRIWLVQLLCAVPDEKLRDIPRARELFDSSTRFLNLGRPPLSDELVRAEAVLVGAEGNYEAALRLLDAVDQLNNDEQDRQWIDQQRAAFSQQKPYTFLPLTDADSDAKANQ